MIKTDVLIDLLWTGSLLLADTSESYSVRFIDVPYALALSLRLSLETATDERRGLLQSSTTEV